MPAPESYRFGPFLLEVDARRLLREGAPIELAPKVFDALVLLVRNAGRLVTRGEFVAALWPDVQVSEGNLKQTILVLRRTLGDEAGTPTYVATIPREGYRFEAAVSRIPPTSEAPAPNLALPEARAGTGPGDPGPGASSWTSSRRPRWVSIGLAAGVIAIASVAAFAWPRTALEKPLFGPEIVAAKSDARTAVTKGRFYWAKRSNGGLHQAISLYQEALRKDPGCAEAWSGLADAYAFDLVRWREAEGLARKALALDPRLSQPHATLGFIALFWRGETRRSAGELDLARHLGPSNATANQWRALAAAAAGDLDGALSMATEASRLDPVSPAIATDLGLIHYFRHETASALEAVAEAQQLDPVFPPAMELAFWANLLAGQDAEAAAWRLSWEKVVRLTPHDLSLGTPESILARVSRDGDPYLVARLLAHLGRRDEALEALDIAVRTQQFGIIFCSIDPILEPLRSDPRFPRKRT